MNCKQITLVFQIYGWYNNIINPLGFRVEKSFILPTLLNRDAYSGSGAHASFHFGDCQWTCKAFGKRPTCNGRQNSDFVYGYPGVFLMPCSIFVSHSSLVPPLAELYHEGCIPSPVHPIYGYRACGMAESLPFQHYRACL